MQLAGLIVNICEIEGLILVIWNCES